MDKKLLFCLFIVFVFFTSSYSADVNKMLNTAQDKTKSKEKRVKAILDLGKERQPGVSNQLENILLTDNNRFCREASAKSLGDIGDRSSIPALKQALSDKSMEVRMRAGLSLAKMGDSSGKEMALMVLRKGDSTVQLLAIELLEQIGDKTVIPELERNLKSKDKMTMKNNELAINRLKMKDFTETERLDFLRVTLLKDMRFRVCKWAADELEKEIKNNTANKQKAVEVFKEGITESQGIISNYCMKVLRKYNIDYSDVLKRR